MGFVVAILITLAVMGSVMWVMPSPREKRIIAMRNKALALGLKVRLLDQKLASKFFPWCEDYRQYVLYEKYFSAKVAALTTPLVIRLSDGFIPHELDEKHPINQILDERGVIEVLPESVEALIFYSGAVGMLWTEKEGEEVLSGVAECLKVCEEVARDYL